MTWRVAVALTLMIGIGGLVASGSSASTAVSEQECIAAGLARPQVLHPFEMHHAGIRPGTPRLWHSQGTSGHLLFQAMPESCAPNVVRTAHASIQMQKHNNRKRWINAGAKNGNMELPGNEERAVLVSYGPTHAWPDYLFNECVGGKGWLKVRVALVVQVKDGESHQAIQQRRYVFPVKVHGSCKLARYSKKATAHYKEEWGQRPGATGSATSESSLQ
jgi:hypothetical protein